MLVWACIAPHGGELIAEIAGTNLPRMRKTRTAMEKLGRRCADAAPDTVIVFTPHGITISGYVSVGFTAAARGTLDGPDGASVSAEFEVDRAVAEAVCEHAAGRDVPVAAFVCAAPKGGAKGRDVLDMDWGAFVPLWFMGARWQERPRIVVTCPSRDLEHGTLMDFGRAVAQAAEDSDRRVAVVCSADLGHGHDEAGPYGFAAESAEYDAAFCKAVRDGALERLLKWDTEWIDKAMTDSFWPSLILHGCAQVVPMQSELLSYQAPTYFGMACAEFRRDSGA